MACTYLILFCKTSEIEVSLRILQNVIQANWHLRDSRGPPPFCGQKTQIYQKNIRRFRLYSIKVLRTRVSVKFWEFLDSWNHHNVKKYWKLKHYICYIHMLYTQSYSYLIQYRINFFWHKIWNTKIMLLNSFISDYKQKTKNREKLSSKSKMKHVKKVLSIPNNCYIDSQFHKTVKNQITPAHLYVYSNKNSWYNYTQIFTIYYIKHKFRIKNNLTSG